MINKESFLKLVEIQTKVASFFPFLIGISFSLYRYGELKIVNTLLFFASMLCVDFATTALNNYMDFRRAKVRGGYNYEVHNAVVAYELKESTVRRVILFLIFIAACFGILLFLRTDYIVLLFGILSVAIGILYSYGPIPISRTPFGEVFSGFFMGGFIFFLTVYIQIFDQGLVICNYVNSYVSINFNLVELITIGFVSFPMICFIANIMLANNLSDLEEDIHNERYTLPYYIGRKKGLILYKLLAYLPYVAALVLSALRILPWTALIVLIGLPIIYKNTEAFMVKQSKKETFVYAVKNFLIYSVLYSAGIFLGFLIF